jgi:hypothetical protein
MTARPSQLLFAALLLTAVRPVFAQQPPSPSSPAPDAFWPAYLEPVDTPRPKPPYTAPFQLRGVIPKNGVRVDTVLGLYRLGDNNAQVTVMLVSAQWRVAKPFALQVRWGIDSNQTGNDNSRTGIVNPTLGGLFGVPMGRDFRFAASVAIGAPVATGGGDAPDPNQVALQQEGALARSAMDNTTFAVNDVGFPTGLSIAYVRRGVTAQIDATVIPSVRVKAKDTQPDSSKVNSTYGFFLGYAFVNSFSLGLELRYQRFLTTPSAVERDPSLRDNLTAAVGPRFSLELSDSARINPAITYGRGLRGRVEEQSFQMIQLDVPISF